MSVADVLEGRAQFSVECADAVAWFDAMSAGCLDLVVGSPKYCDARTYGIDAQLGCVDWVEWMLEVTAAAHRACKGPVFWVCAGVTRERNYWPACEGLAWEWWKRGGDCQLYRPCIYRRVGIPGSGGDDYLRADWEYVLAFKHAGALPYSDNTALGHPPKWAPGGEMSHRLKDGQRVNQWGTARRESGTANNVTETGGTNSKPRPSHKRRAVGEADAEPDMFGDTPLPETPAKNAHGVDTTRPVGSRPRGDKGKGEAATEGEKYRAKTKQSTARRPNGERKNEQYEPPVLANPGTVVQELYSFTAEEIARFIGQPADIVDCVVGGGRMGSTLASENEAPYPERLPEFFIRSFCPPGGIVADCFSGSGTTLAVALRWGRKAVCCDLRQSQVDLTLRRIATETPYGLFE
jgi:hypothetical protein